MGTNSEVIKASQSPLNGKRWCLDLSCGHEMWVTSTKRPKRKHSPCDKCAYEQRQSGAEVSK